MSKKVLILNASPRKSGIISSMVKTISNRLASDGWIAETIDVTACNVTPCRGCMVCRTRGECVLPSDDAQRVLDAMREADAVVIGAPCYWGNMPGTLKILLDRLVYGLMTTGKHGMPHGLMKGRHYAVITSSTTPWPWNRILRQTSGTVRAIRNVFDTAGYHLTGGIQAGGTRRLSGIPTARLLRHCERIATRINRATAR